MAKKLLVLCLLLNAWQSFANSILIPMDDSQSNHLKAYGIAYQHLQANLELDWLINYRGGSFLFDYTPTLQKECLVRGVAFEVLSSARVQTIKREISDPDVNMEMVRLYKAAKIAVYSPVKISLSNFEDTDAVLLALKYAEIPFEVIYDEEIIRGDLAKYDWLHLHHEDFTGQFGKNMRRMSPADMKAQEDIARRLNYRKISSLKLDVAKMIKMFCMGGGYLFAMCSGAETLDIALSAENTDIVSSRFDGDDIDAQAQSKLDFDKTLAFHNFNLSLNDNEGYYGSMSFSDINVWSGRFDDEITSYFNLFEFSAKWDVIPAMLCQNHEHLIREFMGQTSSFNKKTVKPNVLVMGEGRESDRYIYGELGLGQWVFYGGHDPEGRRGFHRIPTDLNLFPHSPGYRLILNNVLFPSAKKKKRKT
ncbi:asparagine synthetase B [Emticicia sp. 21SJ11W-3]|uniref:asparagine synthetase B n=1 Tax=Emticicia sp. 21SJ11W-3 TaxID=2916755 RepID=UPI00209E7F5E|nr:asparagine synthetase B [Emticicia sp. 21SJ11W-3]UTA69255.1 asparagine synthetase B [Emticicia sp. 21SJ11W-3]